MFRALLGLTAILVPCGATKSAGHTSTADASSPPAFPGQSNPGMGRAQDYWTPDRLRGAKPLDLPHPRAEPPNAISPPAKAGGDNSATGAGNAGGPAVPPETTNLLDPNASDKEGPGR